MGKYTSKETLALQLFNRYESDVVAIEPGNPKNSIPPEIAQSLNRKGCLTIGAVPKTKGMLQATLTINGKNQCKKLLGSELEPNPDVKSSEPPIKTDGEKVEGNMLKCVCGKQMKSKSGLTLHQKKCVSHMEQGEVEVESETSVKDPTRKIKKPEKEVKVPVSAPPTTEVPLGLEIVLDGTVWGKELEDSGYLEKDVSNIVVKVIAKQPSEDGIWLTCQAEGSTTTWAVYEADVLSGKYASYAAVIKEVVPPPAAVPVVPKEEGAYKKFEKSLKSFVEVRDEKLKVEKKFKLVTKTDKPVIDQYVRTHGKESGTGKEDFQLFEMGYNVHIVRTPGKQVIKYKEEQAVEWLMKNGHQDCVRMTMDVNMWDNLKAAGKVPPKVINAFEDLSMTKDIFSLTIKEEK